MVDRGISLGSMLCRDLHLEGGTKVTIIGHKMILTMDQVNPTHETVILTMDQVSLTHTRVILTDLVAVPTQPARSMTMTGA